MTDKLKGFLELIIGNFAKRNISERNNSISDILLTTLGGVLAIGLVHLFT